MSFAGNGVFVIRGEISTLMTAMRRTTRWSSHSYQDDDQDPLLKSFQELKDALNKLGDLKQLEPIVFLSPFLDTIKSEDTTGPVTSLALSAVNKFLSYGLIDHTQPYVGLTVHSIADAINHARFISSDLSSDSVVLMKILQVLRTLTLAPEGIYLTNESLCEIMLSCFKICFETKLHELLRRTAEHYLKDIVQLVFMRLPQFSDTMQDHSKQLKMRAGSLESTRNSRRKVRSSFRQKTKAEAPKPAAVEIKTSTADELTSKPPIPVIPVTSEKESNIVDMQGSISQITNSIALVTSATPEKLSNDQTSASTTNNLDSPQSDNQSLDNHQQQQPPESTTAESAPVEPKATIVDYVNPRGIRFVAQATGQSLTLASDEQATLHPYGIACVRELLRFLVSLCNPHDRQNTELMISLGLALLTVAFEIGADSIGRYETLMVLVRDDMCRCLFALLTTERLSIFANTQQVCLLLFESQRTQLKFQLQHYLCRLLEIVAPDSVSGTTTVNVSANSSSAITTSNNNSAGSSASAALKVSYEHREIALDTILQLWRIPGFVTELYLNYDCHMYCPNLFEELGKLLAKNAFPAAQGVFGTHLLSLDALLSVVEEIGQRCHITNEEIDAKKQNEENNGEDKLSVGVPLRRQLGEQVPSSKELISLKNIKRWLPTGTEYFNQKAKKGIQFLQEHDVLETPLNPQEIVHFIRENPDLDKKQIGDYISGRNNNQVLHAFVNLFDFTDTRIDDALRMFLEAFRLPGEAPLISLLLETFAAHWHKSNGAPFADEDAAFTLAYAIIMLNVDQHNHNVRKQSQCMTAEDFKKNLKKVNGGSDFEQDLLDDIYTSIKSEEIVMPAEQTGPVRDNYLWKVLLRRGASITEGRYVRVLSGRYDRDLFTLIWAPTISALSHVLDRAEDAAIWRRALHGFERCAHIAACYGNTANLDMIIATLAKYTQLTQHLPPSTTTTTLHASPTSRSTNPNPQQLYIQLGGAPKAQLALRTMFTLVRQYGDGLREDGWRQLLDTVLALFAAEALPKVFCESEDFIEPIGKVALVFEYREVQKQDTGLLSSLYSYMVSSENISKVPTLEEQELIDLAKACIKDCNLEQVITDSKFLHVDALVALIKTLIDLSKGPDVQKSLGYAYNESVTIFFLELLVKIVLQNRDRVMCVWQAVRDHLYTLPMNACHFDYPHLLQRSVVALLRLAVRLMRNEEMSGAVLQSLHMLLLLKASILYRISKQIAYGLYELLKTSAQNIHTSKDWALVFTLLECVGAGAQPPRPITDETQLDAGTRSDGELDLASSPVLPHQTGSSGNLPGIISDGTNTLDVDRGYTSDSELAKSPRHQQPQLLTGGQLQQHQQQHRNYPVQLVQSVSVNAATGPLMSPSISSHNSGWILVGSEGEVQQVVGRTPPAAQYGLDLERSLGAHDPHALLKCCESLAFLVRDVAHITPYNFDDCVHCIRTFVEASSQANKKTKRTVTVDGRPRRKTVGRRRNDLRSGHRSPTSSPDEDDESEEEDEVPSGYHQVTIQLLDLMHTLHTRTAQIFKWWAEESASEFDKDHKQMSLWTQGWCPLLQGIARLCCDTRKQIRMSAITYLQRALLVHDLQTLTGPEWEACFHRVLFPLLSQLLQPLGTSKDLVSMEETRMRAATVLSKVFLHHLTPLLSLPTFASLWLIILDFMDKYMHADGSDLLAEAIPESLKNMLLVMESAGVFTQDHSLWPLTWQRIGRFLPMLKDELFQPPQQQKGETAEEHEGEVVDEVAAGEKLSQSPAEYPVVQHNIENATRSSIILQPPNSQHGMMNSTLFAHLGQMVSTPIGPPNSAPIIYPQPQYTPKQLTAMPMPIPTSRPVSLPAHLLASVNSIPSPLQPQHQLPPPPLPNHPHQATSPISPVRNPPMPLIPTQPLTTSLISTHPPLAPIVTPLPLTVNLPSPPSFVTIAPPLPVFIPNSTSAPHTFPVLYAASPPVAQTPIPLLTQLPISNNNVERKSEEIGSSIYADYLDNPYNMAAIQSTCSVNNNGANTESVIATVASDMFQTSHYFGGTLSDNSDDLFQSCLVQGANNIPFNLDADVKNSN